MLSLSCDKMRFASNQRKKYNLRLKNCQILRLLPKNGFCVISVKKYNKTLKNSYVLRQFVLETSFGQICSVTSRNMRFASNLQKEYNLPPKTAFNSSLCWKLALPKFKRFSHKKGCYVKSAQKINLARENYVLRKSVLESGFCKTLSLYC